MEKAVLNNQLTDSEKEELSVLIKDTVARCLSLDKEPLEDKDGTPITQNAILLNRFEHWLEGSPDGFKKYYERECETIKKDFANEQFRMLMEKQKADDELFKKIMDEAGIAILQKDFNKLYELEQRKSTDERFAWVFRSLSFADLGDAVRRKRNQAEKMPKLFKEFPTMLTEKLPEAIKRGLVSKITEYKYKWEGTGAEYGEFVERMASIYVPADMADEYLIKEQHTNKGNDIKKFLQFPPYREIFINGEEMEAAARSGNSRRNGYTQPTGKMKDL